MPRQLDSAKTIATFHCVTFMLGEDLFGIEIGFVREVIEYEGVTPVPMMPIFVRGIINLRGAVIPVLDLSVRFGRGPTDIRPSTCIAILSLPAMQGGYSDIGIMLDSVCTVLEIPLSDIGPAPTLGTDIRNDFIQGIATVDSRFAILLNVQNVLSVTELAGWAQAVVEQHWAGDEEQL